MNINAASKDKNAILFLYGYCLTLLIETPYYTGRLLKLHSTEANNYIKME